MDVSKFYINGQWVAPVDAKPFAIVSPVSEQQIGTLSLGNGQDVDAAVAAARAALPGYSAWSQQQRVDLLDAIIDGYKQRMDEVVEAIIDEMGAPTWFARDVQAGGVIKHFSVIRDVLAGYQFEQYMGTSLIRREPIGVCGLITAWNWPLNLIVGKLAPALAAGCTVVLKPSEFAPLSPIILTEVLHAVGVPPGVFNLIYGTGPEVGAAIAAHPGIDMVSITGSTRAGAAVAKAAADTVKKVHQELGGKSAHIITREADFATAVPWGVLRSFTNSGQACEAPTRMLVPRDMMATASAIAKQTADAVRTGDPRGEGTRLGPLVNAAQFARVQDLIQSGIDEGATLVTGGTGKAEGMNHGYYVRPTVFADVDSGMRIAREEIFGPVLSILPYDSEAEAIEIANSSVYGLAAYVHGEHEQACRIGNQLKAGRVYINGAPSLHDAPFGGYKQSGNGRHNGIFGFEEYLEVKAMLGHKVAGAKV